MFMGRQHTFMDREFGRQDYDPSDRGTFDSGLVFVIMPFTSADSAQVYAAIREECEGLKLRPRRADEESGSGFILKDITALIERAEFLICDLTEERPNVYYELGYAHGVGNEANEVLLVAHERSKLHFDIAPLRVHLYRDQNELRHIVRTQLSRMIAITRS
jgi:hypothetical protein